MAPGFFFVGGNDTLCAVAEIVPETLTPGFGGSSRITH
jgi:hypothetical protein